MMISPETFYREKLEGKSAEEILSVIRGLKREIGRLKNIMEHPEDQCMMHPSENVRISCNRDYLERAKQALVEVGGTYTPSQAELRAEKFNANLSYVSLVEFNINSFHAGYEGKTYTIENGELTIEREGTIPPDPYDFRDEEMDKDTLLAGLADLHIGEWRREYAPKRFDIAVRDSFTWNLNFYFSNGARPVKISGYNSSPYNFEQLLELLNIDLFNMEDLR